MADTLASLSFELWFLLRKCRPDLEGDFRELSPRPALPWSCPDHPPSGTRAGTQHKQRQKLPSIHEPSYMRTCKKTPEITLAERDAMLHSREANNFQETEPL